MSGPFGVGPVGQTLQWAAFYAGQRLVVVPADGKKPSVSWAGLSTNDPAALPLWFPPTVQRNVAILTGSVSGLFVLDVDVSSGKSGAESLQAMQDQHGALPVTLTATTGTGGKHYYFRYPNLSTEQKVKTDADIFRAFGLHGVDVRGDGGVIIAPPSIHPVSSQPYTWDTPLATGVPLASYIVEAPAWLTELVVSTKATQREVVVVVEGQFAHLKGDKAVTTMLSKACESIVAAENGMQESTLFRKSKDVGKIVGAGALDYNEAFKALIGAAKSMKNFDPARPWKEESLSKKVEDSLHKGLKEPRDLSWITNASTSMRSLSLEQAIDLHDRILSEVGGWGATPDRPEGLTPVGEVEPRQITREALQQHLQATLPSLNLLPREFRQDLVDFIAEEFPEHFELIVALGKATSVAPDQPALAADDSSPLVPQTATNTTVLPNVPVGFPSTLAAMNANYACITGSTEVYDFRTRSVVSGAAVVAEHSPKMYAEWRASPERLRIDPSQLVFRPDGCFSNQINLFDGLPELEDRGECAELWFEHVRWWCDNDPELYNWVVSRLAFKVQNPGKKIASSIVLIGIQGNGKNLLFEPLVEIFGRYGEMIEQQQLDMPQNSWVSQKLFIVANEVESRGRRDKVTARLKVVVTDKRVAIEEKYRSTRWEDNWIDIHFLSNKDVPMVLDEGDRRFLVLRRDTKLSKDYYQRLAHVNVAELKQRLLDWPCGEFHTHTEPPLTSAKKGIIDLSKDPVQRFLDDWLAEEIPLPVGTAAASDLYTAFLVWAKANGEKVSERSQNWFSRQLKDRLFSGSPHVPDSTVDNNGVVSRSKAGGSTQRCWTPDGLVENGWNAALFSRMLSRWLQQVEHLRTIL